MPVYFPNMLALCYVLLVTCHASNYDDYDLVTGSRQHADNDPGLQCNYNTNHIIIIYNV